MSHAQFTKNNRLHGIIIKQYEYYYLIGKSMAQFNLKTAYTTPCLGVLYTNPKDARVQATKSHNSATVERMGHKSAGVKPKLL